MKTTSTTRPDRATPVLEPLPAIRFALAGEIGRRLRAVTEQWVLPAPHANPGMIAMFHERDRRPARHMMPWAGEFAGKYLTHATAILALTRDPVLEQHLRAFVGALVAGQAEDGYFGPWPRAKRLGVVKPAPDTWDAWGHYHVLLGLLKWHELTSDERALAAARRVGDFLCATFLGTDRRLHDTGALYCNLALYHGLLLLFGRTGEVRYRALADEIEKDFQTPPAGDYIRRALRGESFATNPQPRWESLHAIQGIAENYFQTGAAQYRQAFEQLWWDMLRGDRHNNGGFTTSERATGDPCRWGAIETCCTVAWTALSVDMLRLTGESVVADELELTLFNSGLGLMSPSGRWVTYDTPMEGRRWASPHTLAFQAQPSTPELNCCSVNGPRVLGLMGEWALLQRGDAVVLNFYGPGTLSWGRGCRLTQTTDYPRNSRVEIRVELERPETFPLALRIPCWSANTTVTVAGQPVRDVRAGQYLTLERRWQPQDVVTLDFDFRPHYWAQGPGHFYADWVTDWRVVGPAPLPKVEDRLAALARGPDASAATLTSTGGVLDFRPCRAQPGDTVLVFTEVESNADTALPIRFCADWYSVITLNGQKVFDDGSTQYEDATLRLYRLDLPLRRGKNRIGWAVTLHPNHPDWHLTVGKAVPTAGEPFQFTSIYRGPILLAFDHRFNAGGDAENVPGLDARQLSAQIVRDDTPPAPWLLVECRDVNGRPLRLCDFASAGATGNPYRTWCNVRGVRPVEFTRTNPLRTTRPDSL